MVFGVLMIAGAVIKFTSDQVECGGETMRQGDVCVSKTRYGKVIESTLEESRTSAKVGTIMGMAIGAVIIVIGAQNLRIGIRNRKASRQSQDVWPPAQAPMQPFFSPPQQQQYPPQQQYYQPQQYYRQPPGPGDVRR